MTVVAGASRGLGVVVVVGDVVVVVVVGDGIVVVGVVVMVGDMVVVVGAGVVVCGEVRTSVRGTQVYSGFGM